MTFDTAGQPVDQNKPKLKSIDGGTSDEIETDEKGRLFKMIRGRRHWLYTVILTNQNDAEAGKEPFQTEYAAPWTPDKDFVTPESIGNACAATVTVAQKVKHVCLNCFFKTAEAA